MPTWLLALCFILACWIDRGLRLDGYPISLRIISGLLFVSFIYLLICVISKMIISITKKDIKK